jgi:hypothetical protein
VKGKEFVGMKGKREETKREREVSNKGREMTKAGKRG